MIKVLALNFLCLLLGEVLDSLKRFPVVFYQHGLSFVIDPLIGIYSCSLHLPIIRRYAPRGEEEGNHMKGLGAVAYKVELSRTALNIGHRVRLESMDEIREFDGIPNKENLEIIPYQVPVAIFGIKFNGKAPGVT